MQFRTTLKASLKVTGAWLLAGLLSIQAFAPAWAASAPALVTVSGPSPYSNCTLGGAPGVTNYPNAEVEPYVAVNPANPKNVIGVWQQDRWSDGGAHGLAAAYSFNGGKTWTETTLPFSACAPGGVNYERSSDPWVSFGPDGVAYAVGLPFNESNFNSGIVAAVSKDGGKTWTNVRMPSLIVEDTFKLDDDKEAVTADPNRPGVAYLVWDRYVDPTSQPDAVAHAYASQASVYFSMTTDWGATWSDPRVIAAVNMQQVAIGNQIVIDPRTGTIYNFYDLSSMQYTNAPGGLKIEFIKSTDGGQTWSAPQFVDNLLTAFVYDPITGNYIRTEDIIPSAAIDPATGQLYLAWQDARFNGGKFDEVVFSTSTDGGQTWSAPVRASTPTGHPAFNPTVSVNSNGVVAVTYDDFRFYTSGMTSLPTDYWITFSSDHGATFGGEKHLAGSFDLETAPVAGGLFLGDYMGLAASGSSFIPFFTATNSGNLSNRTDVFSTVVTP